MYTALEISKYIISKCTKEKCPISNLQLQRLLYVLQREFLIRDKLLFFDDFEAWEFGPVVPNVYYKYCGFGAIDIIMLYDIDLNLLSVEDKILIDEIIERKRNLKPWEFIKETQNEHGAWETVFNYGKGSHRKMNVESIKRDIL